MTVIFSNPTTPAGNGGNGLRGFATRAFVPITGPSLGQVRVTFQASWNVPSDGGLFVDNASIGIGATVHPNTTATPVQLFFSGAPGFQLTTSNQTITSDWANLPGFTSSDKLAVIFDQSSVGGGGVGILTSTIPGCDLWYESVFASYNLASPTGFSNAAGYCWAVLSVETQAGAAPSTSGDLAATEGGDTAAFSGSVTTAGALAATEGGDTAAFAGNVRTSGTLTATEAGDTAAFAGSTISASTTGALAAAEGGDTAAFTGRVRTSGALAAVEAGDTARFSSAPPAVAPRAGGFDYNKAAEIAARLVLKFGAAATLRKKAGASVGGDLWAPTQSAGVSTPIVAVLTNYTDVERTGTLIAQGDRKVIFGTTSGVTPVEGDQILIGARAFTIVALTTAEPGGVPIVYIAQVRL